MHEPAVVDEGLVFEIARRERALLVGEAQTWIRSPFETQAQAMQALLRVLPASPRDAERGKEIAAALRVDQEALRRFLEEHPEVDSRAKRAVDREGHLARTLASPEAMAQRQRVALLPRGGLDEALAHEASAQLDALVELIPSMAPPRGSLVGWHRSRGVDDLRARVEQEVGTDREVLLYFRASWAAPCVELEQQVLDDPEVRERTDSRLRFIVDLSETEERQEQLVERLNVMVIPSLMLYSSVGELAAALDGGRRPPAPHFAWEGFSSKEAVLEHLPEHP